MASRPFSKRAGATACSTTAWTCCIARSVAEEAHAQNLPLATHTGDARDVTDAVEIGSTSRRARLVARRIPDSVLERMARQGVYLDPTLAVGEAYSAVLRRQKPMRWQVRWCSRQSRDDLLKGTRDFLAAGKANDPAKAARFTQALPTAEANLLRAWKAGVPLVMGTDSGNPLVFPGPSMHRELQLWVKAGIPAAVALQAATLAGARLLRAESRFGAIRKGLEADLLLVDGNPLEDISATQRISTVIFRGERIRRSALFDQK